MESLYEANIHAKKDQYTGPGGYAVLKKLVDEMKAQYLAEVQSSNKFGSESDKALAIFWDAKV